ncbi:hemicentin-2-like [Branchiostoma lanceolatum]|uniref:hemicentin-2-like n=1 Tax=Branchiostoma lanceolatum TaxID=7740 RepID=UPI0034566FA3
MEPRSWVRVLVVLACVLIAGGLRPRQTIRDYYDPIMHILTLNCTVARVRGESRLSWHRNSQLSDGPKIDPSDYTVFVHKNGRKDISAVISVPLPTRVDPDVTDYFSCVLRKGKQQDGLIVTPKAPTKVFLIDRDGNWRNEAFYEGTDLRLRCGTAETRQGVGYHIVPTAIITWKRDGQPVPKRARTIPVVLPISGSGRLVMKNISMADSGEYSCHARNVFGQGEATRQVRVFKPGEPLQVQTVSPVYGLLGETVALPCRHWSVFPYETETRWFQLNQTSGELVPVLDYSYSTATCLAGEGGDCDRISAVGVTGRHSGEGSLQLRDARLSDSGTYVCRVESGTEDRRVSVDRTVQLAIRLQGYYKDDIVISEQYNNETQDLLLACSTAFGHPRRQLAWFKNGSPVYGGQVNVRADGFMERVRNLVGFHSFLKVERLTRGDVYSCQAPHPLTQAMMSTSVTITSPLAKDIDVVPYPKQNPIEFEDLALECKLLVKISPRPYIRWEREGGALPSGVNIRDDVLLVPNAMIEDAGKYKCEAENIFGSAKAEAMVHVRTRENKTSESTCNTTAIAMDVERCQRRFNHTLEVLYRIEQEEHRSPARLCSIHQELLLCMKRAMEYCRTWETSIGIYLNSTRPVKEYCHSPSSQAREENVWSKIFVSVIIFLVVYVF